MPTPTRIDSAHTSVFLRNLAHEYPVITHGKGIYLYDSDGKKYVDAVSGAYVASVGHGNDEVASVVAKQLQSVAYINGTQFTTPITEELAQRLAKLGKNLGMSRSYFLCSGSEAIEAAVKLARQIAFEKGELKREKIIARVPSYHGNTLFALGASGRPHYKKPFTALYREVVTIPAPTRFRSPVDYEKEGAAFYTKDLESLLEKSGKEIFALLIEPVSGSSMGGEMPPPGYFAKIMQLCKAHNVLIICDEVLVGAGRVGKFFASDCVGLKPDIIVLGKGLNGGYAPLSAVLTTEEHYQTIVKSGHNLLHAQTFQQAPCMTAAGVGVLRFMEKERVIEGVDALGAHFHKVLREELKSVSQVVNITGQGLLAGVEVCPSGKEPFERDLKIAETVVSNGLENGMTLWPNVGHVDGNRGDLILLAPPLISTKNELSSIANVFQKVLRDTFSKVKL